LKWAEPFLTDAHVCSIREAGFQTGKMQEGKGGAWRDFTFGIATQWTGVKA
jgi:2-methoxy-6-polyprenyl-1,4-benzoquinol methylase